MEHNLRKIPQRTLEYTLGRQKINAAKMKLLRELKNKIRAEWTERQAVEDIERQVHGLGFAPPEATRSPRPMTTLHNALVETLNMSLICDLQTQRARRTDAVRAIAAYCEVEEPLSTKLIREQLANGPSTAQILQSESREQLRQSVIVKADGDCVLRCFICVAKGIRLSPDDPKVALFCHSFSGRREVLRHFRVQHLSKVGPLDRTRCPICPGLVLKHKAHLERHADDVHGLRIYGRWTR